MKYQKQLKAKLRSESASFEWAVKSQYIDAVSKKGLKLCVL